MTKTRAPLSIEQALQRIAGQCSGGVEQMAEAVDRQPCTIRNWMDPDRVEQTSIEAAIQLDLLFRAEGGEGCPLFEAYGAQLDVAEAQKFMMSSRLQDYAVGVIKEGGEAHAAIVAAARPGATLTEKRVAFKEGCEAYEKLRDVLPLLQQLAGPTASSSMVTAFSTIQGENAVAQAP